MESVKIKSDKIMENKKIGKISINMIVIYFS